MHRGAATLDGSRFAAEAPALHVETGRAALFFCMLPPMSDERYVDAPPSGAEGWRKVWRENLNYRPGGVLQSAWQKLFNRGVSAARDRQRDFNVVVLDLLHDLRVSIDDLRRDIRADFEALQRDMKNADDNLAREMSHVHEMVPIAAKRNDALVAALDQKIETLAVRLRDLTNPTVQAGQAGSPVLHNPDYIYRRLEDGLRGTDAEIREAMRPYAELAKAHQPAIDVGCGRGEFLVLCREDGIEAKGFDTNERSVADLEKRGFDVALAGIPQCFERMKAGSVGSILAAHVVEHLPAEILFALYREAARVLRSGGLLMIETPNAESMLVSATEFWRDPTHLAPRHPAALTLLGREHGFDVHEVRALHPFPEGTRIHTSSSDDVTLRHAIEAINNRLFGPQDLRVVLRKQ